MFQAWTDGERLKRWCCPTGFAIPFSEGDIRPGGKFRTCMRSPQGEEHWLSGDYIEIVPDAVRTEPNFMTLFAEYNKYLLRRLSVWLDI